MSLRLRVTLTVLLAAILMLAVAHLALQDRHPTPRPYTNCVTETIVPIPSTGWAAAYLTCRQ